VVLGPQGEEPLETETERPQRNHLSQREEEVGTVARKPGITVVMAKINILLGLTLEALAHVDVF
jgi:uncharacterized membrane protein YkgB